MLYPLVVAAAWLIIYKLAGIDSLIGGITQRSVEYIIKDLLIYGLMPGLGEEPLFRVLVIQFLLLTVYKGKEIDDKNIRIGIILISAICFAYGHIYIVSWAPFSVNYNVIQLVTSLGLGVFYAITYIKTKSILTAIVCHNYSDLVVRAGSYILFFWLQ